jgi:hypothetical protein
MQKLKNQKVRKAEENPPRPRKSQSKDDSAVAAALDAVELAVAKPSSVKKKAKATTKVVKRKSDVRSSSLDGESAGRRKSPRL